MSDSKNFDKAEKLFKEILAILSLSELKKTVEGLKLYKKILELRLELISLSKDFELYRGFYLGVEKRRNQIEQRYSALLEFLKKNGASTVRDILDNSFYKSDRTLRRDLGYLISSGRIKIVESGKDKKYYSP